MSKVIFCPFPVRGLFSSICRQEHDGTNPYITSTASCITSWDQISPILLQIPFLKDNNSRDVAIKPMEIQKQPNCFVWSQDKCALLHVLATKPYLIIRYMLYTISSYVHSSWNISATFMTYMNSIFFHMTHSKDDFIESLRLVAMYSRPVVLAKTALLISSHLHVFSDHRVITPDNW